MWFDKSHVSKDNPRLIELLREVRDLANHNIADEAPRDFSEPYISVWEEANRCLRWLGGYESGK